MLSFSISYWGVIISSDETQITYERFLSDYACNDANKAFALLACASQITEAEVMKRLKRRKTIIDSRPEPLKPNSLQCSDPECNRSACFEMPNNLCICAVHYQELVS